MKQGCIDIRFLRTLRYYFAIGITIVLATKDSLTLAGHLALQALNGVYQFNLAHYKTQIYSLHFNIVPAQLRPTPKPANKTLPCNFPSLRASHKAMGTVEETVLPTFSI